MNSGENRCRTPELFRRAKREWNHTPEPPSTPASIRRPLSDSVGRAVFTDRLHADAPLTAPAGWINDPNGLSYYQDELGTCASGSEVTDVSQPCEELGRVALRTLVERILHRDLPPREILLGAELVLRDSTR